MEVTQGEWAASYQDSGAAEGFTRMEATYLLCVVNGMSSKEAARAINRGQETVKKGLKRAYYRVEATCAPEAVAKAQAKGWLRYIGKAAMCAVLSVSLLTGTDDGLRRSSQTRLVRRVEQVEMYA